MPLKTLLSQAAASAIQRRARLEQQSHPALNAVFVSLQTYKL